MSESNHTTESAKTELRRVDRWLFAAMTLGSLAVLAAAGSRCYGGDLRELACSVQDDSYYYLLPAYNLAHAGIWSFDGETPTYGFQPLYALLLAGLAKPFDDRFAFLRGALYLSHVLHVAAAWALAAFVRRAAATATPAVAALLGWTAGGLVLADHARLLTHTTLKENVLYAVLLPLALRAACAARERANLRTALATGLWLGLSLLTRLTPSSCAVAAVVAMWTVAAGRTAAAPGRVARLAATAAGAAVVLLPWLAYASRQFGRAMPTSAAVKTHWLAHAWRDGSLLERLIANLAQVPAYLADVAQCAIGLPHGLFLPQRWADAPIGGGPTAWFTLLGLACAAVGWFGCDHLLRRSEAARLPLILLPIALAFTALNPILLHAEPESSLVHYAQWYVAAEPPLFTALATIGLASGGASCRRIRRSARLVPLLALALAALAAHTAWRIRGLPEFAANHRDAVHQYLIAVERADRMLPHGSRIGCWNAGAAGYFSAHRLINLDGLDNDHAFAARRTGVDTHTYAAQTRLEYLLDAVPPHGWFDTNAFDRIEYLDVTPLETPTTDGVYLGQITSRRFPDFDPPLSDRQVTVQRWMRDPTGSAAIVWRNFAIHATDGPALRFHTAGRWAGVTCLIRSEREASEVTVEVDDTIVAREPAGPEPRTMRVAIAGAQTVRLRSGSRSTVWLHSVTFEPPSPGQPPPRATQPTAFGESFPTDGQVPTLACSGFAASGAAILEATHLPRDAHTALVLGLASDSKRLDSGARALIADPPLLSQTLQPTPAGMASVTIPPVGAGGPAEVFAQLISTRNGRIVATSRGLRLPMRR